MPPASLSLTYYKSEQAFNNDAANLAQSCGHDGLRELVGPHWTKELLPDLSEELALLSELAHLLKHRSGLQ